MEYECPNCGFVTPIKGEVSDPTFQPEAGYVYTEYCCPNCDLILFITREEEKEEAPQGPHIYLY